MEEMDGGVSTIDGSMSRSRDEDPPTELATTVTSLLLGLPVPTHSSERSVLATMRGHRCGSSPLSMGTLSYLNDRVSSQ